MPHYTNFSRFWRLNSPKNRATIENPNIYSLFEKTVALQITGLVFLGALYGFRNGCHDFLPNSSKEIHNISPRRTTTTDAPYPFRITVASINDKHPIVNNGDIIWYVISKVFIGNSARWLRIASIYINPNTNTNDIIILTNHTLNL